MDAGVGGGTVLAVGLGFGVASSARGGRGDTGGGSDLIAFSFFSGFSAFGVLFFSGVGEVGREEAKGVFVVSTILGAGRWTAGVGVGGISLA